MAILLMSIMDSISACHLFIGGRFIFLFVIIHPDVYKFMHYYLSVVLLCIVGCKIWVEAVKLITLVCRYCIMYNRILCIRIWFIFSKMKWLTGKLTRCLVDDIG